MTAPELAVDHPMRTPVMLRRELVRGPSDDRLLRRLVADGTLVKVRRGAYVDGQAYAALDATGRHGLLARAVQKQAGTDVVLSHSSALPEWGCPTWGFDLGEVHVTRPDGRAGRAEAGVRQHCGRLLPEDVVTRHGIQVSSPTRLALEVTTFGQTEAALCVVNDLLHRGLTTRKALADRYTQVVDASGSKPRELGMTHWPHTLVTEHVLRLADQRLESVGETRTYHLIWKAGLPLPIPQVEIRDARGRVIARVDFAWPELGVFLEFDGRVKYQQHLRPGEDVTAAVLREKRREQEVIEITGWRPIRLDWADLDRSLATADRIEQLLGARPSAA